MQKTRRIFQGLFFLAAMILTARNLLHLTKATVESYCPNGGIGGIYFYLQNTSFVCATSGINLIMFLTIFIGTLLIGRAWCSWLCPIGTIVEFLTFIGRKGKLLAINFWRGPFSKLQWFRYVVLGLIIYYTYAHGDLIFRPFCPLYVGLSGQSHEIEWWSKWLMLGITGISILLPFFWCKMLCPLGATLGIGRLFSPLTPTIDKNRCISCNKCSLACPQEIDVMKMERVVAADCTQCGVCVDSCPKNCIGLKFGYKKLSNEKQPVKFLPKYVLPLLIIVMISTAFAVSFTVQIPTLVVHYERSVSLSNPGSVDMIVKGLRCRGQSMSFSKILKSDPNIYSLQTYASEHKAHIVYDTGRTDPEKIRKIIENGIKVKRKKKTYTLRFHVEKILP